MTTFRVSKSAVSEAIQVVTPEDRAVVESWMTQMGYENEDIEPLIEAGFWFLRDEGSTTVYLSTKEEFPLIFEVLGEAEVSITEPEVKVAAYEDFVFGD